MVSIIRYEDLVINPGVLKPVVDFLEVPAVSLEYQSLHDRSLERWKKDARYGFSPSAELLALAERYGYLKEDLNNSTYPLWPAQSQFMRGAYRSKVFLKTNVKAIRALVARSARKGRVS